MTSGILIFLISSHGMQGIISGSPDFWASEMLHISSATKMIGNGFMICIFLNFDYY